MEKKYHAYINKKGNVMMAAIVKKKKGMPPQLAILKMDTSEGNVQKILAARYEDAVEAQHVLDGKADINGWRWIASYDEKMMYEACSKSVYFLRSRREGKIYITGVDVGELTRKGDYDTERGNE